MGVCHERVDTVADKSAYVGNALYTVFSNRINVN